MRRVVRPHHVSGAHDAQPVLAGKLPCRQFAADLEGTVQLHRDLGLVRRLDKRGSFREACGHVLGIHADRRDERVEACSGTEGRKERAHLARHVGADVDGGVPLTPRQAGEIDVAIRSTSGKASGLVSPRLKSVTVCPSLRACSVMWRPTKDDPPMRRMRMDSR